MSSSLGEASSWTYVAEGGANLVVAYAGPHDDSLDGTVLRIRKKSRQASTDGSSRNSGSKAVLMEEDASVAFTDRVVIPLLPPHATPKLVSLPVESGWLQSMSDHVEHMRPAARRAVDGIDIMRGYVVQAENLVGSPKTQKSNVQQLSVEIKPKWGFLPRPDYLSDASRDIKTQHCRFCLHQIHRRTGKEVAHSLAEDYCPLDLYSGQPDRVRRAIHALVDSWQASGGKGNNLKLFWNGRMLTPAEISHIEFSRQSDGDLGDQLSSLLVPFIASSLVVKRLKLLQGALDPLDIEGLEEIVRQRENIDLQNLDETSMQKLGGAATISEFQAFVSKWAARIFSGQSDLDAGASTRDLLIAYLLSATFKDCSMFVRIRTSANEPSSVPLDIEAYLVDCDVKSMDRMEKWAKLDRAIRKSEIKFMAEGGHRRSCLL